MEFKGATLLYTLAGLMITFAGFSALLLTLRPAAGARLSLLDRYLARTVMTYIFVLTAGALLPALLALYDVQEKWIWRGAGVLFALPMLSLQVTYPHRRRKVVGTLPPPAIFGVDPLSWTPQRWILEGSRWQTKQPGTRRSLSARWSRWYGRDAGRRPCTGSLVPRPGRSVYGSSRPPGMRARVTAG